MCDTIYCSGSGSPFAVSFFGKNSDRNPSEPQAVCIVPGREPASEAMVGGKRLPVKDAGYAFVLSKPSWMAGGEMGMNDRGVAIGNEAVFSRHKPAKDGILGMDILRSALMASASAKEAVDFLCGFVETHEQGGNGAYKGSLYYNNSFLVSDRISAYIVETAGHRWAWRSIAGRDAISNAYSITEDYKRLDAQTRKEIAPVNERAACSDEADPGRKGEKESFKAHVEDRFYLRFTKGEQRRALSLSLLDAFRERAGSAQGGPARPDQAAHAGESEAKASVAAAKTSIAAEAFGVAERPAILDFLSILRSHGPYDPRHPWRRHMESLCVHSGGFPASATTASFAVEYKGEDAAILWFTGTSYPCVSLYKPILLAKGEFIPLWSAYDYSEGAARSHDYWQKQKSWLDRTHAASRSLDPDFAAGRERAQEDLALIANRALAEFVASGDRFSLSVLLQEACAIVAGWEKDCGL